MKRALFLIPVALGAALWGVNWKLDHPPQSRADVAFARLVGGADEVELSTFSGTVKTSLHGTQLGQLRDCLRFQDKSGLQSQGYDNYYTLVWKKKGKVLARFDTDLDGRPPCLWGSGDAPVNFNHNLNPRFGKQLENTINEFLPAPWQNRKRRP